MRFSVSSLSFTGGKIKKMRELPPQFGIEIFYEWGSPDYWDGVLPGLLEARGGFSIHGPMMFDDLSAPCGERELFEHMKAPFGLYHKFRSEFYVVHTNGGSAGLGCCPAEREELRKRAAERLWKLREICEKEDVIMAVENVPGGLFSQEDFLGLFRSQPGLQCLIDIGHTLLSGLNVEELQKELGNRIIAYHIHDNDGKKDLHLPAGRGIFDWKRFLTGVCEATPEAELVLEYEGVTDPRAYAGDQEFLEAGMPEKERR